MRRAYQNRVGCALSNVLDLVSIDRYDITERAWNFMQKSKSLPSCCIHNTSLMLVL